MFENFYKNVISVVPWFMSFSHDNINQRIRDDLSQPFRKTKTSKISSEKKPPTCTKYAVHQICGDLSEWCRRGERFPMMKYLILVKPHSSPWFLTACAVAAAHRNQFFRTICTI